MADIDRYFDDLTTVAGPNEGLYHPNGSLQTEKLSALSRTYAQVVAGTPTSMKFDESSAAFRLQYGTHCVPCPHTSYYTAVCCQRMHSLHGCRLRLVCMPQVFTARADGAGYRDLCQYGPPLQTWRRHPRTSLCVCACACACARVHALHAMHCMHLYICMPACICSCACTHACVCVCARTLVCLCVRVRVSALVPVACT